MLHDVPYMKEVHAGALARRLGVSVWTVYHWRSEGVPAGRVHEVVDAILDREWVRVCEGRRAIGNARVIPAEEFADWYAQVQPADLSDMIDVPAKTFTYWANAGVPATSADAVWALMDDPDWCATHRRRGNGGVQPMRADIDPDAYAAFLARVSAAAVSRELRVSKKTPSRWTTSGIPAAHATRLIELMSDEAWIAANPGRAKRTMGNAA